MPKQKIKSAFTLVELIVVITILAILWTIAFISLQWYSSNSRDSVRINDISKIKTSLELYNLNSWKYPLPDEGNNVIYDTDTLWTQWNIWKNVVKNLSRNLNKIPKDPLTEREYVYSVTNKQNEYELLSLMENDDFTLNNTIAKTSAEWISVIPRVSWEYNWVFVKSENYIVPTPSIINAEVNWAELILNSTNISSQVISWWENVPWNLWNIETQTWTLDMNLIVYTWSITKDSTDTEKINVITAIKNAYTGSDLVTNEKISTILNTPESELVILTNIIVLNEANIKNWNSEIEVTTYSCIWTLPSSNVTTSNNTWLTTDTSWQNTNSSNDCYYECTWWYTWVNCDIAPILNAYTETRHSCETTTVTVWIYEIASCNVWATSTDVFNTASYWYLFQWWNAKHHLADNSSVTTSNTLVNTLSCAPNNCKTISFITPPDVSPYDWSSSQNNNLWWWNLSNTATPSDSDKLAKQWVCPNWFHVPTQKEWESVITTLNFWTNWNSLKNSILKLPYAGYRDKLNSNISLLGFQGRYWSSSSNGSSVYALVFTSSYINYSNNDFRSMGDAIRCFKN